MNRTVLIVTALLLPLAGCLGFPEGSAGPGDLVVASVMVTDAETGAPLMTNQQLSFAVGSGLSRLGFSFERQVLGLTEGESATIKVTDDPSLQWGNTVNAQGVFEDSLTGTIDEGRFVQFFGELAVGETFTPQQSFYEFRVEDKSNGIVTFRALPEEGQLNPLPALGATVRTTVDESRGVLIQRLLANEGATFTIQPPSAISADTLLGLEPGAYQSVGNEGDEIVYRFNPTGDHRVVGHDLIIQVTIIGIREGAGGPNVEPVDGNYGVRASPVINGSPNTMAHYGAHAGGSHGHAHP